MNQTSYTKLIRIINKLIVQFSIFTKLETFFTIFLYLNFSTILYLVLFSIFTKLETYYTISYII